MKVRNAVLADAAQISGFLQELAALGKRSRPSDEGFVCSNYIEHEDNIQCAVVEDADGSLLGLQVLKKACEHNAYDVTPGWGIIGTHVRASAGRRGVGRALFASTLVAAKRAGLQKIDATIGASNPEGLGYYEAVGFRSYKTTETSVSKCFELD
ncbi:Acetyltransferase (GNAT) family protein [Pseudovibrio axinellae]|uniref:Acetyltransferase (GNAT) family protein n=1 Tax=Pseudovibrio axinellae TaxID=989403 RepID=A0A166B4Z9_9HYPH|nr:GNAT family N-acetyltransferase [Pseudovibrio axinellae]KZL21892.1 Acetyltransferase (GNAT) family protein [Pseudovibrio axinellae]SEQ82660.1 L-amino acid N-acyltransferase YncA [Pseudovibrio axinellae]